MAGAAVGFSWGVGGLKGRLGKRGMWWYNKELAPDEMLCGERKTEPGALQVRGMVVWLKNRKGIPSGHYIREDIRSWVVKIFFFKPY